MQLLGYPALVVETHPLVVFESNEVCTTFELILKIIPSPWLIFQRTSIRSSKPPIFCYSSKFESCKQNFYSVITLKGIINIIQLLGKQLSFNFLFNLSVELWTSKLKISLQRFICSSGRHSSGPPRFHRDF